MATGQRTYTGVSHRCSECSMQVRIGTEKHVRRDVLNLDGTTYRIQYDHADDGDCVGRLEEVRRWNREQPLRVMGGERVR